MHTHDMNELLVAVGTIFLIAAIIGVCAWLKPKGDEWDDDHDW